jgi:hypothetical protein
MQVALVKVAVAVDIMAAVVLMKRAAAVVPVSQLQQDWSQAH